MFQEDEIEMEIISELFVYSCMFNKRDAPKEKFRHDFHCSLCYTENRKHRNQIETKQTN